MEPCEIDPNCNTHYVSGSTDLDVAQDICVIVVHQYYEDLWPERLKIETWARGFLAAFQNMSGNHFKSEKTNNVGKIWEITRLTRKDHLLQFLNIFGLTTHRFCISFTLVDLVMIKCFKTYEFESKIRAGIVCDHNSEYPLPFRGYTTQSTLDFKSFWFWFLVDCQV